MLDKLRSYRTLLTAAFVFTALCALQSSIRTSSWPVLSADVHWASFASSPVRDEKPAEDSRPTLKVAVAEFMGHHDEDLWSGSQYCPDNTEEHVSYLRSARLRPTRSQLYA